MEESIKNRIIIILALAVLIFLLASVSSCRTAQKQKAARDQEMFTRLDLEEKMSKFTQEKSECDKKITAMSADLEAEKKSHEAVKSALLQEQLVNQSLKEELQKVSKLKEALEEDLKEALTKVPKSRK